MKRLLLILTAFAGATITHAYDYPYLTFQNTDGTTRSVSAESLSMTFSEGKLIIQNADNENELLTVADLSRMYFTESSAGITDITTTTSEKGVDAYSIYGIKAGSFETIEHAQKALERGVYVIKADGKTKKIVIR